MCSDVILWYVPEVQRNLPPHPSLRGHLFCVVHGCVSVAAPEQGAPPNCANTSTWRVRTYKSSEKWDAMGTVLPACAVRTPQSFESWSFGLKDRISFYRNQPGPRQWLQCVVLRGSRRKDLCTFVLEQASHSDQSPYGPQRQFIRCWQLRHISMSDKNKQVSQSDTWMSTLTKTTIQQEPKI